MLVILPQEDAGAADTETLAQQWFAGNDLAGASVGDGNAHGADRPAACTRTAIWALASPPVGAGLRHERPSQRGRYAATAVRAETYRMLALLALPVAKAQVRVMDDLGRRVRALTGQMSGRERRARSSDDALLDQLTELAADAGGRDFQHAISLLGRTGVLPPGGAAH